jgi:hypothetical protein
MAMPPPSKMKEETTEHWRLSEVLPHTDQKRKENNMYRLLGMNRHEEGAIWHVC